MAEETVFRSDILRGFGTLNNNVCRCCVYLGVYFVNLSFVTRKAHR